MNILLIYPSSFTLDKTLKRGFEQLGHTLIHFDYRNYMSHWQKRMDSQKYRMPFKYRQKWENFSSAKINEKILKIHEENKPDLVLIYNNEKILPNTLERIKNNSKVVFFMGDNPYYTNTNDLYLHLLKFADLIITPDSFWSEQLALLGINNTYSDFPTYDVELKNFKPDSNTDVNNYALDIFYVGMSYAHTWGYKRALFLNQFNGLNFKFYGTKHWYKWFESFPELEKHFAKNKQPIPFGDIQLYSYFSKVYPVDANPGILNGVHLRVFDCIATNILPVVEYRKDVETIFKEVNIPIIKNYNSARSVALEYIQNDNLREKTLSELQDFLEKNYLPKMVLNRILSKI